MVGLWPCPSRNDHGSAWRWKVILEVTLRPRIKPWLCAIGQVDLMQLLREAGTYVMQKAISYHVPIKLDRWWKRRFRIRGWWWGGRVEETSSCYESRREGERYFWWKHVISKQESPDPPPWYIAQNLVKHLTGGGPTFLQPATRYASIHGPHPRKEVIHHTVSFLPLLEYIA